MPAFYIKWDPDGSSIETAKDYPRNEAHAEDWKKYTADAVMRTIVAELEDLHNEGFTVEVNGQKQHFHCFLTQVVGDNLGLHSVLGFAENFSRATYACDLCMATQEDMQTNFSDSETLAQTPQLYNMHMKQLEQGLITVTGCGIKRPSALASLSYYHPATNDAADVMHDLFEGVLPLETKLFLYHLLYEVKCLSLAELNSPIKSADFGYCGSKSKPSVLLESHLKSADASLGQRSAQMILLFNWLPLIIADVIHEVDSMKMRLLHLLVEIVLAPILCDTHLIYLNDLIAEHHGLFRICFPDRRLLYKHHRMIHYARIIQQSGPLLGMMVMRYEAKHNFAKRLAHVTCNFKNISYSVCRRHQMAHALKWMMLSPLKGCADVGNGQMVAVSELQDCNALLPFTGSGIDIFAANCLSVFGQEYRPGVTFLLDISDDGEPIFAVVDRLYVQHDTVYMVATKWHTAEYSSLLHVYNCVLGVEQLCFPVTDIADYKPFAAVSCFRTDCVYKHIVLRHQLCYDRIYIPSVSCITYFGAKPQ